MKGKMRVNENLTSDSSGLMTPIEKERTTTTRELGLVLCMTHQWF